MKRSFSIVTLFLLAILPSAGYADEEQQETEAQADEAVCFNTRSVRNFDGLSDQHVYINVRSDENYLLTMFNRCIGLRNAQGIAIKDNISRVCSNRIGSEIIFRGSANRLERCRINSVVRVENKDEARAIVAEQQRNKSQQDKQE